MMDTSNAITLTIVTAPPVAGIPAWATDANLAAGQCKAISLNTLAEVWEGPQPAGGGTIHKAVQAWTSGIDAPLLGPFGSKVFAGGGDADSWDTAVYAFGYATQRWTRIKNRTTALSWNPVADYALPVGHPHRFDLVYGEHGDGTPGAPHTYDLMEYLPPEAGGGSLGALLYPVSRFMYTMANTNYPHKFTFSDMQWSRASATSSAANTQALGMAAYDPSTKRVWIVACTASGFWVSRVEYEEFSTGAAVHGTVGLGKDYLLQSGTMRVWQRGGKRYLVILSGAGVSLIDLDDPNKGIVSRPLSTHFGDGWGFAEVPPLGCFYAAPPSGSATLVKITPPAGDPMSGRWMDERIAMRGTVPSGSANGIWKRFHYAEQLRVLTWFYSAEGPVFAYRPK